jgi:hypothetical protein
MEMVGNINIYTLAHPDTFEVRYVGKTKYSLNERLSKHLLTKENNHRGKWIRNLLIQGKRPVIEILEISNTNDWIICERYWIYQLKEWGFRLLNLTEGGETGIISDKCRKAQINAVTGRKQSIEEINKRSKANSKPVKRYNNNNELIFKSASEASRNGFCLSHITECCNGIRKSHKGYKWCYI